MMSEHGARTMEHPYVQVGNDFTASVLSGSRAALPAQNAADRLRQYAYYLTEQQRTAGDALLVMDLWSAIKSLERNDDRTAVPHEQQEGELASDDVGRESMVSHMLRPIRGCATDEQYKECFRRCMCALQLASEAIRKAASVSLGKGFRDGVSAAGQRALAMGREQRERPNAEMVLGWLFASLCENPPAPPSSVEEQVNG